MNRNEAIIEMLKGKRIFNPDMTGGGCYIAYREGDFKYINGNDNDRVMEVARGILNEGAWDNWRVVGEEVDFSSPFGISSGKMHILNKYDIEPLDLEELLA